MEPSYLYLITFLVPLSALMLVLQTNPYHALISRGILGAVATLVYSVHGAADVALTEALVGTLLLITLYAVAVRSSLILRLGVLDGEEGKSGAQRHAGTCPDFLKLTEELRSVLDKRHMRLELVTYPDEQALNRALSDKFLHAICTPQSLEGPLDFGKNDLRPYRTAIRIRRLYDILREELTSSVTCLAFIEPVQREADGAKGAPP
jgi:putative multicomponent Na+:H+ antiporter subunit B